MNINTETHYSCHICGAELPPRQVVCETRREFLRDKEDPRNITFTGRLIAEYKCRSCARLCKAFTAEYIDKILGEHGFRANGQPRRWKDEKAREEGYGFPDWWDVHEHTELVRN